MATGIGRNCPPVIVARRITGAVSGMARSRTRHGKPEPCVRALQACCVLLAGVSAVCRSQDAGELSTLSLDQLGDVQVTSVSKSPELLSQAPAAIHVITQEDIRRSGATTLAEALQLAPNLRVMQLGS